MSKKFIDLANLKSNLENFLSEIITPTFATKEGVSKQLGNHTVKSDVPENAVFTDTVYDDTEVQKRISDNGYGEVAGGKNLIPDEDMNKLLSQMSDNTTGTTHSYADGVLSINRIANVNSGVYVYSSIFKRFDNKKIKISFDAKSSVDSMFLKISLNNSEYANTPTLTSEYKRYYVELFAGDTKHNFIIYGNAVAGEVDIKNVMFSDATYNDTSYEPYFPSNKMLAEEKAQQSTEMMDIKMLGWSVPRECTVQNEVDGNQFIQKVGRVDLGNYDYTPYEQKGFVTKIIGIKNVPDRQTLPNIYCNGYRTVINGTTWVDGDIAMSEVAPEEVYIMDTSYTDVVAFKSAMKGKYLYYELATYNTMTIDGNEIGETVSDVRKETTVNLLNPTLQTTTINGVTCTANGDGTYTLKGKSTSSSNTNFVMSFFSPFKGKCKLIGCPSGIDSIAELQCNYNEIWESQNTDHGKGSILDSANLLTAIAIVIFPNVSVNNLIFKPMITTNLDATYDDFVPYTGDSGKLNSDVADIKNDLSASNAGAHNSVYRGKYLGNSLTTEQKAQISAGTFNDLYIGDYWTIGGVNYRIAAFDYWLNSGDTNCTTHHVVIVPDTCLYNAQMNTTDVTTGAYIGSEMYKTNLEQAKTTIENAFGSANILSHREYLANATKSTTDPTYESAGSWYDSTVELMNERMVYGADVFHNIEVNSVILTNYTIDKSQLPLFVLEPSRICNREFWWLRDVVSATYFAFVYANGSARCRNASDFWGVRPAFAIKG